MPGPGSGAHGGKGHEALKNQATENLSELLPGEAKPGCPYASADEVAAIIEGQTGIPVIRRTYDYH